MSVGSEAIGDHTMDIEQEENPIIRDVVLSEPFKALIKEMFEATLNMPDHWESMIKCGLIVEVKQ